VGSCPEESADAAQASGRHLPTRRRTSRRGAYECRARSVIDSRLRTARTKAPSAWIANTLKHQSDSLRYTISDLFLWALTLTLR
jgi:hypothetical protein